MRVKNDLKKCEVVIKLAIPNPKEKIDDLYKAIGALNKLGITFDTGGYVEGDTLHYDLEFDWSLKGAEVYFKKFVD